LGRFVTEQVSKKRNQPRSVGGRARLSRARMRAWLSVTKSGDFRDPIITLILQEIFKWQERADCRDARRSRPRMPVVGRVLFVTANARSTTPIYARHGTIANDDESARGPMRCFPRIFIFAGKFLFDLHKLRPEFRISFANHPGPCAQCDVAACHRLRFACQLSLNMPLGRFPISKRISQGTTDAARIF
jgi:hypothetical protein